MKSKVTSCVHATVGCSSKSMLIQGSSWRPPFLLSVRQLYGNLYWDRHSGQLQLPPAGFGSGGAHFAFDPRGVRQTTSGAHRQALT